MEITNHVFVALVPVVCYSLIRYHRLTSGSVLLVALFASLFPDLVDKPLAWTFGIIPSGRMLAHSLVIASVIILCILLVAYRKQRLPHGVVFAWAYLSHIAGDFYPVFTQGTDYYYYPNMFWPIMGPSPARNPGFAGKLPEPGIEVVVFAVLVGYIAFDIKQRLDRRATNSSIN
ncbi:metal-dependent hydrolase [Halovenus amylolytica]|uniref:metal-dependent hydrolase n=1 Tax=Halovenus amylolytica TaxID=2500550 RepID=UPI00361C2E5D